MKVALYLLLLPFITLHASWTTTVDYLYWQGEERFDWAALVDADFTSNSTEVAEIKTIPFDWNSGVRASVAYTLPCDEWTVALDYTYFSAQSRASLTGFYDTTTSIGTFAVPAMGFFTIPIPTFDGQTENLTNSRVRFNGSLTFNQLNLLLKKHSKERP